MARSSLTRLRSACSMYDIDRRRESVIRDMSSFHDRRWVPRRISIFHFFILFDLILRGTIVTAGCGNMKILETGGMSCSLIDEIVNTHNELRQAVAAGLIRNQPIASNMREFYWDEELARGAQDWANQCTFAHNEDKDREVARFQVGQNLALTKSRKKNPSTKKDFRKQISNWFNEHESFKFGPIRKVEDLRAFGHYTQIVWADTYLIGCGYSRYRSSNNVTYRLYVCNYGPTGNEFDAEPYKRGNRHCPEKLVRSKKYSKLCGLTKSPRNSCNALIEWNNTHVGNTRVDTRGKNLRDGRRFLNEIPKEIETVDDPSESTKENFDVVQNENNIILQIFFNFW